MGLDRIINGWKKENNALVLTERFEDFNEALAFIVRVGLLAEQSNHHPTITNTYNEVSLMLTTHDQGNVITEKDYDLAEKINAILTIAK
ncbi:MAG: 4a-hydroxytetrahydrobiopterin dehydratase [Saprospirales bacterium]|nr:4a-hydroxytetrahydrobiopterin dehydratase [Saprospirales bacterium]|tara:strand:+ start:5719 stop:5985 length:267 start_codon:yes stop_codon:yes gene_type:complete